MLHQIWSLIQRVFRLWFFCNLNVQKEFWCNYFLNRRRPTGSWAPVESPVLKNKFKIDFERLEQVRRLTQSGPNLSEKFSKFGNKLLENVKKEIVSNTAHSGTPSPLLGPKRETMRGDAGAEGELNNSQDSFESVSRYKFHVAQHSNALELSIQTPEVDPAQQEAEQEQITCETAQLMMSLLYAWNFDHNLDKISTDLLGLFRPNEYICFGVTSRPGYLSLSLPGSTKSW